MVYRFYCCYSFLLLYIIIIRLQLIIQKNCSSIYQLFIHDLWLPYLILTVEYSTVENTRGSGVITPPPLKTSLCMLIYYTQVQFYITIFNYWSLDGLRPPPL